MGFAVGQSHNALGGLAISLFLFDRAAGGAGFAVSFEQLVRPVLRRAEHILDCSTPGCEKACAACVLTSDAPVGKDELDRLAALEFIRAHLKLPDELGPGDCFVDDAELSLAPIDEIDRELRRSARSTLTLYIPEQSSSTAFSEWPIAAELSEWRKRGHEVRLALAPAFVTKLSSAERLGLRDFALKHDARLITAEAPVFATQATALATVSGDGGSSCVWASREAHPSLPGPAWGQPVEHPVARGRTSIVGQFAPIDLATFLPPPGAQLIEIGAELDGDLATFGARAARLIVGLLVKCGGWPKAPIVEASYRDAYVCSPLVARLLIDTMKQMFLRSDATGAALIVETRPPHVSDVRGQPWQIGHDWRDPEDQKAVMELLGNLAGIRLTVRYAEVPHGRYLDIRFADNSTCTVVLDQGFGAWAPPRNVSVRYDFGADVTAQAKRLASINVVLERRGLGTTYLVAKSG
jgi:hypothetical protein